MKQQLEMIKNEKLSVTFDIPSFYDDPCLKITMTLPHTTYFSRDPDMTKPSYETTNFRTKQHN